MVLFYGVISSFWCGLLTLSYPVSLLFGVFHGGLCSICSMLIREILLWIRAELYRHSAFRVLVVLSV